MKHSKPLKRDTHRSILVSLPKEQLEILSTIIENYKRSKLIYSLLQNFIETHMLDTVLDNSSKNIKGHKNK